jgi:hypothetical protein
MTPKQYHREKLKQLRLDRKEELRLLAESQAQADPRYVDDVVDLIWARVLDRKFSQRPNTLPRGERQRLNTLVDLYSHA